MFLWLRSWAKAGRIILSNSADSGTSDVPDLLVGYPNRLSEDDLGAARATVRAMFGGMYAPICAAERRLAYRALRDRERRGADSDRDRSVRSSRKLGLPDRGLGRTLAVVKTPAANPSLDGPTSTCKDPS